MAVLREARAYAGLCRVALFLPIAYRTTGQPDNFSLPWRQFAENFPAAESERLRRLVDRATFEKNSSTHPHSMAGAGSSLERHPLARKFLPDPLQMEATDGELAKL